MWPGPLWAGGSQVLSGVSGEALACSPSRLAGLPGKGPTSCRVPAPLGPRPLPGAALPSLGPAPLHPSPAFLCGPSCCPQPPSRPPSGMFHQSRGRAPLVPLPARSGSSRGSSGGAGQRSLRKARPAHPNLSNPPPLPLSLSSVSPSSFLSLTPGRTCGPAAFTLPCPLPCPLPGSAQPPHPCHLHPCLAWPSGSATRGPRCCTLARTRCHPACPSRHLPEHRG